MKWRENNPAAAREYDRLRAAGYANLSAAHDIFMREHAASAATGRRECGGPEPDGGDNHRQPVIGLHKDRGPSDGATSSGRASGQLFLEQAP